MAEEDRFLAFLDVERHVVEQHRSVGIDRLQTLDFENLIARLALHREDDARILAARRTNFLDIKFFEHLFTRCSLFRLRYIGRETTNELFQFLALLLRLLTLVLRLTKGQLRRLIPERIVAREHRHLAKVDIDRLRRNGIEEVAVVAHDEHALFQRTQVFLQPLHGIEVEVVGRLVEQQVVGVSEQRFRQHHAHFFVVRQFRHQLIVLTLLHTEVLQQLGGLALGLVAVHLGECHLQFRSAVAVLLGHFGLRVECLALLHILPQRLVTHQHSVHHRVFVVFEVVLRQHRKAFSSPQFHRPFVRLQFTTDGLEQRRFSGTVGTDDSVDVSCRKLDVHVLVKYPLSELNREIRNCYHIVFPC